MAIQDIKLYAFNTATLTISMTDLDVVLKLLLLVISIGYTLQKWYVFNKRRKNDKINREL
tara:strand:+ start:3097 stop:3276 length:180 start_codon:yes stop_codon:yes gene_type:complete